MKRLLAAAAALTMLTGTLASCGGSVPAASDTSVPVADTTVSQAEGSTEVPAEPVADTETLRRITNGMYKYEELSAVAGAAYVWNVERLNDDLFTVSYSDEVDQESRIVLTDHSFKDFAEIQYELPEELQQYDQCHSIPQFNPDGSFNCLAIAEDSGGMIPPKTPEEAQDFDFDAYYDILKTYYYACSYDKDGKLISYAKVEFPEEYYQYGSVPLGGSMSLGRDIIVLMNSDEQSVYRISTSDGSYSSIYTGISGVNGYTEESLFRDRDGKMILATRTNNYMTEPGETEEPIIEYREIKDDGTLSDVFYSENERYGYNSMGGAGYGEYRLTVPKEDGLYGIRDDNSAELLINWKNSGIEQMTVCPIGDDEFVGVLNEDSVDDQGNYSYSSKLIHLIPRDASEMENTHILTVGLPAYGYIDQNLVNKYNNSQDNYHVDVVNYGEINYDSIDFTAEEKRAQDEFEKALISGDIPDIVAALPLSQYNNLAKKGVFEDLGQLMDSGKGHSRSDFVSSVLDSLTFADGKIYAITPGFSVKSKLVKTKVWDKPTWTLDEMISVYDSHEDTAIHLYDGETKQEMLQTMANTLDGLIDYKEATCNFNDPQFIKVLEFCNRFVDEVPRPDKFTDGEEANQAYWTDRFYWFSRDEVVTLDQMAGGVDYCLSKYLQGGGEDMIYVGYPSDNGSGGRIAINYLISITSACKDKEAAWDFLCFIIENSVNGEYEYSVLKEIFEKNVYSEVGVQHSASGKEFPPQTKEEADMIRDYILSCRSIENNFDSSLWGIIEEEAGEYFAGAISAEEAAGRIQNRAEILISEKQ